MQLFIQPHVAASLSHAEPRTFSARNEVAVEWIDAAMDGPLMVA